MKNNVGHYGIKDRNGWVVWDGVSPLPKKYSITKGKTYHLYFDIMNSWYICDDKDLYITDLRYFMYDEDYSIFKYGIKYGSEVVVKDEFKLEYKDLYNRVFKFRRLNYSPNSDYKCLKGIFYDKSNINKEYSIPMTKLISLEKHRSLTIDNILK